MPADYIILNDDRFSLVSNTDKVFAFKLPTGVRRAGNQRPILAFRLKPSPMVGTAEFRIEMNGHMVIDEWVGWGQSWMFWEVINDNVARAGANTIKFRFLGPSGDVVFSDVVLWYQQE